MPNGLKMCLSHHGPSDGAVTVEYAGQQCPLCRVTKQFEEIGEMADAELLILRVWHLLNPDDCTYGGDLSAVRQCAAFHLVDLYCSLLGLTASADDPTIAADSEACDSALGLIDDAQVKGAILIEDRISLRPVKAKRKTRRTPRVGQE